MTTTPTKPDLVYRPITHQPHLLVGATRTDAFHVHKINSAIQQAKTWEQFGIMLPAGEWERIVEAAGEDPSLEDDKFSSVWLPGYSDGDYPEWLPSKVGHCIPAPVLAEFGVRENSVINGPFWEILLANEKAFVTRLKQLGYSIERRDDWTFF